MLNNSEKLKFSALITVAFSIISIECILPLALLHNGHTGIIGVFFVLNIYIENIQFTTNKNSQVYYSHAIYFMMNLKKKKIIPMFFTSFLFVNNSIWQYENFIAKIKQHDANKICMCVFVFC